MTVTKLKEDDLVIYTNKGIMVVKVLFNTEFWNNILLKLEQFYLDFMIPEILTQQSLT